MFWHVFIFVAVVVFLLILVYRTVRIVRLPVHLRWELAPIPHEKGRAHYGGSYFEEYEWWDKPRRKSRLAVVRYMAVEILLLRAIWKHNRGLWPLTLAFHTGIYLVALTALLATIGGLALVGGAIPASLYETILIFALVAYILGGLGAIGLIIKRATDDNLKPFNSLPTYFNLVFLLAIFITGIIALSRPGGYGTALSLMVKQALTLESINLSAPLAAHVSLALLFIIYLPFTNMIHFVAKYFTYHEIKWDDRPQNTHMTEELKGLLTRPVGWASAHVKSGDKRTWADTSQDYIKDEQETKT